MKAVKVKDQQDATVMVEPSLFAADSIYLAVGHHFHGVLGAHLTPAQARRVAKALLKFAEGK